MKQALAAARRSLGRTFPNPSVGAVVFRGNTVLGRGATKPPPGPHAEVVALEAARRRFGAAKLRGASIAVTLEPCCFTGRTGPCTEALIEAGIRRVYLGCRDPHARVRGRGIARLRRAGIEVDVGVLEDACREQHRGFFSLCKKGRPFVTLKLATTLDGRIATARGESRWITGEASRAFVHDMRAHSDAVMVGSQTAIDDDPELFARKGERIVHRPVRIVVDTSLRTLRKRPDARLLPETQGGSDGRAGTWLLCARGARGATRLEGRDAMRIEVARRGKHLDLPRALAKLGDLGLTSVFVEGGGGLAAALLRAQCVDEIHWFQAPKLIGGDGRPALGGLGVSRLIDAIELKNLRVRRRGEDLHISARLDQPR
ncbi:MAG: bifunctional diaminohydroxyphosphoribosylaminopyrimidine deaminase/5-amino-6-(5-phosphoribosylamino)uracil reductase RibD [Myxococcota bacterium]|jgi:diaminohydroxyphosphoribosylaminopyrimidine deaminase/5-amino-6-(5-phosphoribosylamino)uracil reductase|nr:bifunctional diaminohydroxyphosphoribosylaminopyrimidine deaminase/5-amino-6-(5-phosphoribosylamino)uracil reductase RibD [Myxococcota bacterium]